MRCHAFFTKTKPLSQKNAEQQRRPSARHMDDSTAGKINGSDPRVGVPDAVHEPIDSPHHVGKWEIDEEHPERDESEDSGKLYSFRHGADDESGCNDSKHQLVHGEDVMRDPE